MSATEITDENTTGNTANADKVLTYIVNPAACDVAPCYLSHEIAETFAKFGENGTSKERMTPVPILGGNTIYYQVREPEADNSVGCAAWAWAGGTKEEHKAPGEAGENGGIVKPTHELTGMGLILGPRNEDGTYSDVTLSEDEIGWRVAWSGRRLRARAMLEMMIAKQLGEAFSKALGIEDADVKVGIVGEGGKVQMLGGGSGDDECDCPSCQMDRAANTGVRSAAIN